MIELTNSHGDIWTDSIPRLLFVVSQIMRNREFEEGTRQSALEIISTCAESMPGTLRKNLKDL